MAKSIVLTGGGTAGHVNPNLALVPALQKEGWQIAYMGSYEGIEKELVTAFQIPYFGIAAGKLRRYFDWKNFTDPLQVVKGLFESYQILQEIRPQVIFSKGGFVTVPVVIAGWLHKIPVIIHESDFSPGLANKLALPFATEVWVTFPETARAIPHATVTGLPIRQGLLEGNPDRGRALCSFSQDLPILLVIGGSTGSVRINTVVRELLPTLTDRFQVIHLCGKGNIDDSINNKNYRQFAYLDIEMKDVLAMADVILSRAGANVLFEFLALQKPHLLIPLSRAASRGDQILNARSFAQAGFSALLEEENLTTSALLEAILQLYENRYQYVAKMQASNLQNPIPKMLASIELIGKCQERIDE